MVHGLAAKIGSVLSETVFIAKVFFVKSPSSYFCAFSVKLVTLVIPSLNRLDVMNIRFAFGIQFAARINVAHCL